MQLRLLMVTSSMPDPPASGAAIRISQFCHHLAAHHKVTLLTYGGPEAEEGAGLLRAAGLDVTVVGPERRPHKRATQLMSLGSRASHLGGIFHSNGMQSAIDQQLVEGRYDAVLVESSLLMRHGFSARTPLVLDEHNLEFEGLGRMARVESSKLRRLFNALDGSKFEREEMAAWRRADLCVFTSEREARVAQAMLPAIKALTVPNGVDVEYFAPRVGGTEPDSIVFVGTLGYRPNEDAVLFLAREVMPHVLRVRPRAVLTVVGGGADGAVPQSIQQLAGPSVVATGRVPDVRPFIARAAVVVTPLRVGSGTRLKVLEALAMGKAVVSTSVGCEGISVEHSEHLLIADSAEEIAREIVRVLEDRELAGDLGARGRALVERAYDWKALCAQMEGALLSLAEGRGAATTDPDKGPRRIASAQAALPRG